MTPQDAQRKLRAIAAVLGTVDPDELQLIVSAVTAYISTSECTEPQKQAALTLMIKLAHSMDPEDLRAAFGPELAYILGKKD